jgi:hypothetical protein
VVEQREHDGEQYALQYQQAEAWVEKPGKRY